MRVPDVRIRLKLLSEAIFDSGEQATNHVHTQALSDAQGCVYYHAKTFKGVLKRQAFWLYRLYKEMGEEQTARTFMEAVADLFGIHDEEQKLYNIFDVRRRKGYMRLGNLQLPISIRNRIAEWLGVDGQARERGCDRFSPQDILEAQTNVRTIIQMEGGVVKDRMLTFFHTVKEKLVFESQVEFERFPDVDHLQQLLRIVRSLERIGAGENRGYGRVEPKLLINGREIEHPDEVERALEEGCEPKTLTVSPIVPSANRDMETDRGETGSGMATIQVPGQADARSAARFYVIEIRNEEPLKIGAAGSKENPSERSLQHIPGSTIRGALIAYLQQMGLFQRDETDFLQHLLCQNGYLYRNGHLFMPTPQHLRLDKHRYRQSKMEKRTVELSDYDHDSGGSGKNQIPYRYVTIHAVDGGESKLVGGKVKLAYRLHHSTIRKPDQRERENLYNYQAISEGHAFRAIIRYEGEHGYMLDEVLAPGRSTVWYLGGARSAGYGRCVVTPVRICATHEEAVRAAGYRLPRRLHGDRLTVICLTDSLFRDRYGQPAVGLTSEAVEKRLAELLPETKTNPVKVVSRRLFLQTGMSEGYNAVWNARYPKETIVKAGSVMQFALSRELSEDEWRRVIAGLEAAPCGSRVQEGFGWLLVNVDYPKRLDTAEMNETIQPPISESVATAQDGQGGAADDRGDRIEPMDQDEEEALLIIRNALIDGREQWLMMIARRLLEPVRKDAESALNSSGTLILSDRLHRAHLHRMLSRILDWLNGQERKPGLFPQFQQSGKLPVGYAFYEQDKELFSLASVHLRGLLEYLNGTQKYEELDQWASDQLSTVKGRFYYSAEKIESNRIFIAELLAVTLYLASRERKGAAANDQQTRV
jgi:hypothetical protein